MYWRHNKVVVVGGSKITLSALYLYCTFLFCIATNLSWLRMTVHVSSQTCPSEISDDDCSFGSVVAIFASIEKYVKRGRIPRCEGAIISASGKVTNGPEYDLRLARQLISVSHQ